MVRTHGWELPAHAFQVVAITVYFLLVVAYYVFFAPFLGPDPLVYSAIGVYTVLAVTVFFLYVRCTGINPADAGVLVGQELKFNEMNDARGLVSESSGSVVHRQGSSEIPAGIVGDSDDGGFLSLCCGCLCGWAVVPDGCKRELPPTNQTSLDDDVLYCTLCNAEVHKLSKHCRSCDKCVDGFDHHCRWLNNCVGRKNYASFVALMATSLVLLVLQWGTGIAVFVLCFVNKGETERQIVDKLGNGFSRAPFAAVVAVCTGVSLLASVPLGELFFFHLILMKKGITTYEYVVAMRAQNEQPQGVSIEGDAPSVPSSPGSSTATGLTGSSSLGLQYRGAWCTPPRVFIDHQDEVIAHLEPGRVPSTVDPDSVPKPDKKQQKRQVKISAWKLAKLNPAEATKAAAKARQNSSIFRQVSGSKGADADYSSSDVGSSRSSASTDFGVMRGKRPEEGKFSIPKLVTPRDYNVQFDSTVTSSRSSISSPQVPHDSDGLSPLPSRPSYAPTGTLRLSTPRTAQDNQVRLSNLNPFTRPLRFGSWANKFGGGDGSSVDSLDDRTSGYMGRMRSRSEKSPDRRNSVFSYIRQAWPEISTSTYDIETGQRAPSVAARENPPKLTREAEEQQRRKEDIPRKADDLLYPENSIFFGGPLPIPGTSRLGAQQPASTRLNHLPKSGAETAVFQANSSNRLPVVRGSTARSHSPVFVPRFSNLGGYPPG